jgi:hypothetical protein
MATRVTMSVIPRCDSAEESRIYPRSFASLRMTDKRSG